MLTHTVNRLFKSKHSGIFGYDGITNVLFTYGLGESRHVVTTEPARASDADLVQDIIPIEINNTSHSNCVQQENLDQLADSSPLNSEQERIAEEMQDYIDWDDSDKDKDYIPDSDCESADECKYVLTQ